jgi:peptidoglycan hydrolase-like protein with peptidoglycan-binding domain
MKITYSGNSSLGYFGSRTKNTIKSLQQTYSVFLLISFEYFLVIKQLLINFDKYRIAEDIFYK